MASTYMGRSCPTGEACHSRPPCHESVFCAIHGRNAPAASVRPLSRDRYLIVPGPGNRVVLFDKEVVIMSHDGTETTRLRIEPPGAGREIAIVRTEDGAIEVIYHDGVTK